MGIQSNYLEAAVADAILSRSAAIPSPATLYFALFTAMPDENGLNGQEVVAGSSTGYQRKPVANTNDEFPPVATWARSNVVDKGVKYNVSRQNNSIAFPPALSDWGDVVGFGIYDALTGGNLLISSTLDTTRTVARNDTMRFVDRELRFTEFGQVPDNILSFFMQRVVLDTLFGRSADYVTASATDVYFSLFTQMPEADEQGYAVEVQCDITSGTKKVTMSISTAKGIKEGMVVSSVAGSTASVPDKTYVVSVGTDNVVELSSPVSLSTISNTGTAPLKFSCGVGAFDGGKEVGGDCTIACTTNSNSRIMWMQARPEIGVGTTVTGTGIPAGTTVTKVEASDVAPNNGKALAVELSTKPTESAAAVMLSFSAGSSGYARVGVANTATNFPAYANGVKSNATQVVWPACLREWSGVKGLGIYDAPVGGNLLFKIPFTNIRNFVVGEQPRLAASALSIYLD